MMRWSRGSYNTNRGKIGECEYSASVCVGTTSIPSSVSSSTTSMNSGWARAAYDQCQTTTRRWHPSRLSAYHTQRLWVPWSCLDKNHHTRGKTSHKSACFGDEKLCVTSTAILTIDLAARLPHRRALHGCAVGCTKAWCLKHTLSLLAHHLSELAKDKTVAKRQPRRHPLRTVDLLLRPSPLPGSVGAGLKFDQVQSFSGSDRDLLRVRRRHLSPFQSKTKASASTHCQRLWRHFAWLCFHGASRWRPVDDRSRSIIARDRSEIDRWSYAASSATRRMQVLSAKRPKLHRDNNVQRRVEQETQLFLPVLSCMLVLSAHKLDTAIKAPSPSHQSKQTDRFIPTVHDNVCIFVQLYFQLFSANFWLAFVHYLWEASTAEDLWFPDWRTKNFSRRWVFWVLWKSLDFLWNCTSYTTQKLNIYSVPPPDAQINTHCTCSTHPICIVFCYWVPAGRNW